MCLADANIAKLRHQLPPEKIVELCGNLCFDYAMKSLPTLLALGFLFFAGCETVQKVAETQSAHIPKADEERERRIQLFLSEQDKNQDGKIYSDEAILKIKANFSRNDYNGDGFIDRAELGRLADRLASN